MLGGQRTNNLSNTMPILLDCPRSIKKYMKFIEIFNEDISCPCCGRVTRKHGKYERTINFKHQSYRIPILRRRCPDCDKTFSLLPSFSIPWGRFGNHLYELFVRWILEGKSVLRLAEQVTTAIVSVVSHKTLYRWKRRFMHFMMSWLIAQRKRMAHEYTDGEGILTFFRQGMNTKEELHLLLAFCFSEVDSQTPGIGRLMSGMMSANMFPLLKPIFLSDNLG